MAKIKILIVEDEPLYAGQLEMIVTELGYLPLGKVSNSQGAIDMTLATQPDLILMDVNIEGDLDGIETAKAITEKQSIPIIFITSMQDDDTFQRAKSTSPYAFITKPFSPKKLQRTIELAIGRMHQKSEEKPLEWNKDVIGKDSFYIKTKNTLEKVIMTDILWIEVLNRNCTIHTEEKPITVRISLSDLTSKIAPDFFMQVHRSYIVNIDRIESVDLTNNKIIIKDNLIPISKSYKDDILAKLDILQ